MVGLTKAILLAATILSTVAANPLGNPAEGSVKRQNDGPFIVTGASVGGSQPRQEVRNLQQQPEAWNLFLLALQRFKAMNQTIETSYYQICGIHGQPLVPWDGVQSIGDPSVGYCPHGSNLFGPWHKPYLALFEQILSARAQEIAREFPAGTLRNRYIQVASTLRLPYWDWATRPNGNGPIYPALFSNPTVTVTFPNNTRGAIPNPLLRYEFHPLVPSDFSGPWDTWTRTVRQPADVGTPNSADQHNQVEAFLDGNYDFLRNTLYQILTQYQSFNQFSNTGSEISPLGSLEGIHNAVHGAFGSGHMGFPSVAAFDPIFWLHHANVDRIMLLFQTLYPNTYVTAFPQFSSTYMNNVGDTWDATTPLWPFHSNSNGAFFNSNSVRRTGAFSYTYPELVGQPSNNTLKARINALYGPRTMSIAKRQENVAEHKPRAYLVVIESPLAFDGTYSVDIFLGDITTPSSSWYTDANYVGAQVCLSNPGVQNHNPNVGSIVLTEAIQAKFSAGALPDLSEQSIIQYLTANLHWRVVQGGVEVPREQVPSFKVSVKSIEVQPAATDSDFPQYVGEYSDYPEVTAGRPGGATA